MKKLVILALCSGFFGNVECVDDLPRPGMMARVSNPVIDHHPFFKLIAQVKTDSGNIRTSDMALAQTYDLYMSRELRSTDIVDGGIYGHGYSTPETRDNSFLKFACNEGLPHLVEMILQHNYTTRISREELDLLRRRFSEKSQNLHHVTVQYDQTFRYIESRLAQDVAE